MKRLLANALNHNGFMKYFRNTSWLFGGQMLRMILGLLVSVAVARYLGPKDFGLYSYVVSLVTLVGVISSLGLQNLAKRELVELPQRRESILGTCFVLSSVAAVIAYSAMLIVVSFVSKSGLTMGLFAVFAGTLFLSPLNCIEIWFQSQLRSDLSVISSSIALLVFSVIKVGAIIFGADLLIFAYIYLFESICLCVLQVAFYNRHFGWLIAWKIEYNLALEFLKQSWPLLLSGIAVTIYMRIDQVMLGAMLGEEAVGQYSVAVRISSVWYFIPAILATSLFPAILKARKHSAALYETRLQQYFDLNSGLAYIICVPLAFFAPWLIHILFGAQFEAAASILSVHTWGSLFVFLGVARGQYLIAEKRFMFSLVCTFVGAILNVTINYILIPVYGGIGAAVATLLSQAISAFISSILLIGPHSIFMRQLSSLILPRLLLKLYKYIIYV